MRKEKRRKAFEATIYPHLSTAYNLARWLLRDSHDAEDAVQSSCLKAFRAFDQLSGNDPSGRQAAAWLLSIVRNTCRSTLKSRSRRGAVIRLDHVKSFSEQDHSTPVLIDSNLSPEATLIDQEALDVICAAVAELCVEFREIVVLREFEDLSYREISEVTGLPIGTVMSRLSRARKQLRRILNARALENQQHEL